MDARIFSAHADILLRGFRLHADGRLYHPVVVEQVSAFLEYRDNERERKAKYRNRMKREEACPTGQTRDGRGSPMGRTLPEPEPEPSSLRSEILDETSSHSPQTAVCAPDRTQNCPQKDIVALYHEVLPMLPQARTWAGNRQRLLAARWREDPGRQSLDWWRGFFEFIAESKFLTGRVNGNGASPPFMADLEWIVRPQNFQKINDGRYHR